MGRAPITPTTGWRTPATIVAVVSAVISLASAGASIYSAVQANSGNNAQRNNNEVQAMTSLSDQSEILQKHVKDAGIDDVPKLTRFLYLLFQNYAVNNIPDDFYQTQIQVWCPITRQAHNKLKIEWIDNDAFRQTYRSSLKFLEMLNKLVGNSPNDTGGCV
jgi:hypothetical protein